MIRENSLAVQWLGPGGFTAVGSIPGQGTKIPQAMWFEPKTKKKKKKNFEKVNHRVGEKKQIIKPIIDLYPEHINNSYRSVRKKTPNLKKWADLNKHITKITNCKEILIANNYVKRSQPH